MPTVTVETESGKVEILITSKCMICGVESDDYAFAREHVDNNSGHYFVPICR